MRTLLNLSLTIIMTGLALSQDLPVHYSRQPRAILDNVLPGKGSLSRISVWQAQVCNWTPSPSITVSVSSLVFLASQKISVTDLELTQSLATGRKRATLRAKTTGVIGSLLQTGAMIVPALQGGGIITGSPWISGGAAAAGIVMEIVKKEEANYQVLTLPGIWKGALALPKGECGSALFLGEYQPSVVSFEGMLPALAVIR